MDRSNNIVVVVNRSSDAGYVLQKAAAIAKASPGGSAVHVVRVIYEDFLDQAGLDQEHSHQLKLYLMQAEEEFLVDLVEDYKSEFDDIETATLWNKRVSDAVLGVVDTFAADLVIKSADPESAHFPRHPDDWNLLRQATCPVFLMKPEAWPDAPVILSAVNVTDIEHAEMNQRIITAGSLLSQAFNGPLHVVNALPQTNPLLMRAEPGLDLARLETELAAEIGKHVGELVEAANAECAELHQDSGPPAHVVKNVADKANASVVVVGTAGRKGVSGMIIGNTSETLLHTLHQDLLVLHV
jgi:universal stress protein E